ncbi:unnamed protein product [Cercospora beticola]|nr:unnamed protein product [Cercospora beticola]
MASSAPAQGIGDVYAQGDNPVAKYMRSWHYAAVWLTTGGFTRDLVIDLYSRTQKMASEHNKYLQLPPFSGDIDPRDYYDSLLTAIRSLEDECWRPRWANAAQRMRDLGWTRAAGAIDALANGVVVNGRYIRDLTPRDEFSALYFDVEHQLLSRNIDHRTIDRYRGQKERIECDLEQHGTFVLPRHFTVNMSPQEFCENLMTDVNQSRVNYVKPFWDAALAVAQPAEKADLQQQFEKMSEFVTAHYDPYKPYQYTNERREPGRRLAQWYPFDAARQTIFNDDGTWQPHSYFGGGNTANVMLWCKIDPRSHQPIDRVAVKEMYFEEEWTSPEKWEAPIYNRIPREYALAKSLNNLNVKNVVEHRDYGLFERVTMLRLYLEFCEYGDLKKKVKDHENANRQISTRAIWSVFEALATVLLFMERGSGPAGGAPQQHRSLYHRDIKPDNIMFTAPRNDLWRQIPTAKLGDFGLGIWTSDPRAHAPGVGTAEYMAPEVHDCWRPENEKYIDDHQRYHTVTMKSEVWSVGLVIMTMMNRDTDDMMMPAYRCNIPGPNFEGKPGKKYPLPLQELVLECLKHNPEERPTPSRLWETIQSATGNLKFMQPSGEECDFANPQGNMYAGFASGWQ